MADPSKCERLIQARDAAMNIEGNALQALFQARIDVSTAEGNLPLGNPALTAIKTAVSRFHCSRPRC